MKKVILNSKKDFKKKNYFPDKNKIENTQNTRTKIQKISTHENAEGDLPFPLYKFLNKSGNIRPKFLRKQYNSLDIYDDGILKSHINTVFF